MSYSKPFRSLWQEYTDTRKIEMSEDQFAALVYTFPSVLVAHSDGQIDDEEKYFMKELPQLLTDGHMQNTGVTLTEDYFREIAFILQNSEKWQPRFMEALRSQLSESTDERNTIFKSMWQTADSSEDISAKERRTIDDISKRLGL